MTVSQSGHETKANRGSDHKRFLLVLVYVVLLLPWIIPAAQRTLLTSANSPLDWVDERFQPRQKYDRFCEIFGAADSVIISWPGCTIDDRRLDDFTDVLRHAPGFQLLGNPLFHQVDSGRELLQAMTAPPLSMDRQLAVSRLSGSVIGSDGKTTCVVIGFSKAALKRRSTLVPLIRAAAKQYCGVPYASQHLAGPVMDGYHVDLATKRTMRTMAPLSSLVVLLICYVCLDSLSATILVFAVSVFCQAATLALIEFTGGTMTALMSVLAPLVQVLAIAGGIHYMNYYFDAERKSHQQADASSRAFRIAWLPCSLSSVTTAIGIGSLSVSGLVAVREFGQYAAFGVVLTAVSLLTFLSGFCSLWPIARPRARSLQAFDACWDQLANVVQRRSLAISVVTLLLMLGLGVGVSRLQASVRIETLFASDSHLISDYRWIEAHVGSLVPIEIVANFDEASQTSSAQLQTLDRIAATLQSIPQVDAVVSPITFLPAGAGLNDPNDGDNLLAIVGNAADKFNLCAINQRNTTHWRTTAYVSALADNDYVEIMDQVDDILGDEPQVKLVVSGLMPLVHQIQQQLLADLFRSFLLAFGLIAILMTIVQAGLISGLLSMIPNVFPALTLFGLLGWLDRPLDIGTIMTASVAMGIAVDDTLHFLAFYHRAHSEGAAKNHAVALAYRHCGPAMIQTTAICGGGLSLFMLSDFAPTAGFAWMSVLLLLAALIGDLIVLPAILLSPFGNPAATASKHVNTKVLRSNDLAIPARAMDCSASGVHRKPLRSQPPMEILG